MLEKKSTEQVGYQFGTFKGVFLPNILTILGIIMYMRFGWVLGHAGLLQTLAIVTLATSITLLTSLSISMLSTNMKVGGGGAFFIISRSLGLEAGGAVGLPLYLAQTLSISFYMAGFSESLVFFFPMVSPKIIGIVSLSGLTLLAYTSASLALRTQYFILIMILLSLISFFSGGNSRIPELTVSNLNIQPESFWSIFAVFFPAVTGILSGLALSGDLKNPSKSLPWGTVSAVLVSFGIYIAIPIFLNGLVIDSNILITNSLIMVDIARWGFLILLGLWGATLSSALGSLLGAPRTLQALSKDKILPRFLGLGFGPKNDPRIATAFTFFIALGGILVGDLNMIAPVLSMFFLVTYGLLNLSATFGTLIASPSWRPKFTIPWWISFLGAFGCFAVMFMINAGATFVALFTSLIVYVFIRRKNLKTYWGDLRHGILMLGARFFLYRLADIRSNEKSWMPNILVLSGSPTTRWYLIALADAISHGKGFLTVAMVVPEKLSQGERTETMVSSVQKYLKDRAVPALVKIQTSDNVFDGLCDLVKTYGLGPVVPNTILLGETEKGRQVSDYVRLIQIIHRSKRNLVIVRENDNPHYNEKNNRIDLWWQKESTNSGFMLALAYLLQQSPEWNGSEMIFHSTVENETDSQEVLKGLKSFAQKSRLEDYQIVTHVRNGEDTFSIIRKESEGSNLVFLGMRSPDGDIENTLDETYYQSLMKKTDGMPPTAIVLMAENMEFDRIFDES